MNADLLRQRRNLIVLSLVLLIFSVSDTTIGRKVSVLGAELVVGNPEVLKPLAWVFWGYFLLRYYQYWRAEPGSPIRVAFRAKYESYLLAPYPAKNFAGGEYRVENISLSADRLGLLRWEVNVRGFHVTEGAFKLIEKKAVGRWTAFCLAIRAALHVGLNTRHATDHVLPFVLAVAAPVVAVLRAFC